MAEIDGANVRKPINGVGAARTWAGYIAMAAALLLAWAGDLYSIRDAFGAVVPIFGACSIGPLLVVGLLGPGRLRSWVCAILIWVLAIGNARWQNWVIEQRAIGAFASSQPYFDYLMYRFELVDRRMGEATYQCDACWYYVAVYSDGTNVRAAMTD